MSPTHGLLIRPLWMTHLLAGRKRWEVRSRATTHRGRIALIQSGSGTVVAEATLTAVHGPLDEAMLHDAIARGDLVGPELAAMGYPRAYGWALADLHRYPTPIPYAHPQGAVIWVRLADPVRHAMAAQAGS